MSKQVQAACREGEWGCLGKWALQWTKEMELSFCVFLVFPISIETFYVLWSALLCAHFTGERHAGWSRQGSGWWAGGGAVLTRTANYSLSCTGAACLHACLRLGRRIAEAGNDAVRLSSPAPQKSCPFAACRLTDCLGKLADCNLLGHPTQPPAYFICLLNICTYV